MPNVFRVKCNCGNVLDAAHGSICPKCRNPLPFPNEGFIYLYRKGSPLGMAGGFGVYINGAPMGHIGNRQLICIPVRYGSYTFHVAAGWSRRCNDITVTVTPENRFGYLKVWMRPGFWSNSFVLEPSTPAEMPLNK